MNSAPAIAAIVLAAGRSSRMGANKMLLPLAGRPLAWHVVNAACASSADIVLVVLGNEADAVAAALLEGRYQRVDNPRYTDGLSTSLQAGLNALPANIAGALVLLADMPRTSLATLEAILAAAREAPARIVATNHQGRPAPPVYWPSALFADLRTIRGDEGGRSLLLRAPDAVRLVEMAQPNEALDVDAPEDYRRIQEQDQSSRGNG